MSSTDVASIARTLGGAREGSSGWMACCPAHDDNTPSLSLKVQNGKLLVRCHAGCTQDSVVNELQKRGLWPSPPLSGSARISAMPGCRLEQYAATKALSVTFLGDELGLRDTTCGGKPAVEIPYLDHLGAVAAIRYRIAVAGPDRFRWRKGDKPMLYGLDRLDGADAGSSVVLVEGESDAQTLWAHDFAAMGIPGASLWRDGDHARHFEKFATVYVVLEPDAGGQALERSLLNSSLASKVKVVDLGGFKDVSDLYLDNPDGFPDRWERELTRAVPLVAKWERRVKKENEVKRRASCPKVAAEDEILELFAKDLRALGAVGVSAHAKLLYLAVNSRLFERPISIAVKGPSSGGKSFLVESVLKFFPSSSYYALTAMSERALAYSHEPVKHRMLVLYEAAGMSGDFASYLIRSLLSEGRVRYETVQAGPDGALETRLIEREGPTGLIVTTTAVKLHPENETRLISMTVTDTEEQTRAILVAQASPSEDAAPDLSEWHAFQAWLSLGPSSVDIPFARILADKIKAVGVRLRRDFPALLTLIRTHALLHQQNRSRAPSGAVIAELEDYAAVHNLVATYMQDGLEATVPFHVRELVEAVAELAEGQQGVALPRIADWLKIDKSSASRRAKVAANLGYVRNLEDRKGRPARYVVGDPLPDDVNILPTPGEVGATIAALRGVREGWGLGPPSWP